MLWNKICKFVVMKLFFTFLIVLPLFGAAQTMIPFIDFNDFFKYYRNGAVNQLEFQPIIEYKVSDELLAYYDTRGNLIVFDGQNKKDLANLQTEYRLSDHFLTWKIGTTLNMYEEGKMQTLSYNAGLYAVLDSMIVYHDLRYNNLTVFYRGERKVVMTATGNLEMPTTFGDNAFGFKDNGDFFKIFWRGGIYDIDVWVGNITFDAGVDVVAWNDPNTRTFAIFEKGLIIDVEDMHARSFKCGRGFVVYEDQNRNLVKFTNGQKKVLSQFGAQKYRVQDDLVCWEENGYFYCEQNGVKILVANFIPQDYWMKNNTLVFRDAMGGLSVLNNGKVVELTRQMNAEAEIIGNSVLVRLFNRSYVIYDQNKKYNP